MKLNKSKHCLNCNEEINSSNYCPNCGQINSDKKLTTLELIKDFLGDYFTFDSKFFRSLIPLIIKPGHLTREYINGKRVSYIFPLRLYIFTTFIFFFVVTLNTKIDINNYSDDSNSLESSNTTKSDSTLTKEEIIKKEFTKGIVYNIDSTKNRKDILVSGPGFSFSVDSTKEGKKSWVKYLTNKSKHLASMGKEGQVLLLKELINQIPKVMFVLLPLFALLLKLLYLRSKMLYVEHLVFSLHIHTFIFLMFLIFVFIPNEYVFLLIVILILLYLFLSIYNFYRQSVSKSFIKFFILIFTYVITLIPSFVLLLVLAMISI
jgi:hypothetical protein